MIIIAPDKFKGSLSSIQICDIIESELIRTKPVANLVKFPFSDGGNGFLDVIKYYQPNLITKTISIDNPLLSHKIPVRYLSDGMRAYIENAESNGLDLLAPEERNPMLTSTFGLGQIVIDAIDSGHNEIYIGLGGSSTNDGGIGLASALGYAFLNKNDEFVKPIGKNLIEIKDFMSNSRLNDVSFYGIYDVDNIFFGKQGATYVYAKQKGAFDSDIIHLEAGMKNLSKIIKKEKGIDLSKLKGSGAAGGLGGGLFAFFNANLIKGTEFFINLSNIKNQLSTCELLITGEGSLDEQSLYGKVVYELSMICKNYQIPVFAITGINTLSTSILKKVGIYRVYQLKSNELSIEQSIIDAKNILKIKAQEITEYIFNNPSVIK
jgi:glycerate 2-kinase